VATAVLFSSAFPGMFRRVSCGGSFQRTYDALLAAPVDVEELVTAEVSAISLKARASTAWRRCSWRSSSASTPAWGMLLVPVIGVITGFGFAAFGVMLSGLVESIDAFSYVNSAVLTPPVPPGGVVLSRSTGLPEWAQVAAWFNPLYSCVELVRHASFGFGTDDLAHLGILLGFAVVMWRLAIRAMASKLID